MLNHSFQLSSLQGISYVFPAQTYSPTIFVFFPAFCSVNRYAAISPLLAQSFCKDQGNFLVVKAEDIRGLSIYLTDSSDIPSIRALAKDMAASFPKIRFLCLWFERRCEIVSFLLTANEYNRTLSNVLF